MPNAQQKQGFKSFALESNEGVGNDVEIYFNPVDASIVDGLLKAIGKLGFR
jgi:hypothetical protein